MTININDRCPVCGIQHFLGIYNSIGDLRLDDEWISTGFKCHCGQYLKVDLILTLRKETPEEEKERLENI